MQYLIAVIKMLSNKITVDLCYIPVWFRTYVAFDSLASWIRG